MPLYICNTKQDVLDQNQKASIAQAITDIHCTVTGAPPSFVHVMIFEEALRFPQDGKEDSKDIFVRGTIRAGRSDDQKNDISERIQKALVSHTGLEPSRAAALIRETPASWVLEGGEIMPEPGEEAEWFAAQEARRASES